MNPNSTRHQVPRFLRFNWPTQPPASSSSITTIPITVRFRFDILPPQTAALSRSPCRSLFPQSGIEHMREPDARFLQLLPDDRGVHRDIGRVDVHFAQWMIAGSRSRARSSPPRRRRRSEVREHHLPVACFVEAARNAGLDTPRRCSHAGKACPAA